MRRATSACAAALLMRTHVFWLIYGVYMYKKGVDAQSDHFQTVYRRYAHYIFLRLLGHGVEGWVCAERPAHAQRRYLCALMFLVNIWCIYV